MSEHLITYLLIQHGRLPWAYRFSYLFVLYWVNLFNLYFLKLSDDWHWEFERERSVIGRRWWALGSAQTYAHCRCHKVSLSQMDVCLCHISTWLGLSIISFIQQVLVISFTPFYIATCIYFPLFWSKKFEILYYSLPLITYVPQLLRKMCIFTI